MRIRWLSATLVGGAAVVAAVFVFIFSTTQQQELPRAISYEEAAQPSPSPLPQKQEADNADASVVPRPSPLSAEPSSLPDEINLAVPFTPQAPHANWDLPYQEACEEASVLMVARYKKGEPIRSPDDADAEIKTLVAFQEKFLGFYKDTTAEETVRWANEYYGFKNSRVVYDFSIDDIKLELSRGNPVILPAAGRILPNPYFRSPGPLYHMLVVRGYTKDGAFITNDPGTRRGEQFVYKPDALLNAVHDWNGGDVLNGRKAMIVLE